MTIVNTPLGDLRGVSVADGAVTAFLGVPFARAPIGDLRFRPPVAIGGWTGVRDAVSPGPRAIQPASMLAPAGEPESEDCLFLNVWTPSGALTGASTGASTSQEALPVMVWIHGGSFTSGSGSIAWYNGTRLAGRGVVVVSINYRLGALGFLDLEGLGGDDWKGTANLGLADQTLALEWVRDNIASFGGDPGRVTLFGESAGAMSVSAHLGMPASAGLFHRAIVQSGAARHVQSADAAATTAMAVVRALDVDPGDLSPLRQLPAERFRDVVATVEASAGGADLPLPFQPTVGSGELPVHPLSAISEGASAQIPLLAGTTSEEMLLFHLMASLVTGGGELDDERLERRVGRLLEVWGVEADPAATISTYRAEHADAAGNTLSNEALWSAISTDTTFRMPLVEMLDAHTSAGGVAHNYVFAHRSTSFGGKLGAGHATEIPYVFDNLDQAGTEMMLGDITPERRRLAERLADIWVDFANGQELTVPSPESPESLETDLTGSAWPRYTAQRRSAVVLDLSSVIDHAYGEALRRIWLGD